MTVTASQIDTPLEALFDRTAALVPKVTQFTASGTYTKDALALFVDFVIVGGGGPGADGQSAGAPDNGRGGGGGGAGHVINARFKASQVPASCAVTVGTSNNASQVRGNGADTAFYLVAFNGEAAVPDATPAGGQGGNGDVTGSPPATAEGAGGAYNAGADGSVGGSVAGLKGAGGGAGGSDNSGGKGKSGGNGGRGQMYGSGGAGGSGGAVNAGGSGGAGGMGYGAGRTR